jgi:uncharacterized protein with PIN domain
MRNFKKLILSAMTAFLLCAAREVGAAQPASNDVSTVRAKYEVGLKAIEAACVQQKTDAFATYGKNLDAKLKAMKQAGDFDGYVAIEKAKKEYQEKILIPEMADVTNSVLLEIVNQYYKAMDAADVDKPKKIAARQDRYMSELQDNIKRLTMQDNLEDAGKFAAELEKIKKDRAAARASSSTETPASATVADAGKPDATSESGSPRATPGTGSSVSAQPEKTSSASSATSRKPGHYGKPMPRLTETYKAKASGTFDIWKPTTFNAKSGDWIAVKYVSSSKNTMVTFQKPDQKSHKEIGVTFKINGGGSCFVTEDKPGYFRAAEDGELCCKCPGDLDVVVSISIASSDPREDVWVPDN